MAINYTALTSTTQGTQASAISTAVSAIIAGITANSAWTVVNTSAPQGTGNYVYTTLKCAASGSGLSADYYLTFALGGTTPYIFPHENLVTTTANAAFTITSTGVPTGGSVNLNMYAQYTATTYGSSNATIAWNQTAAALQTTLNTNYYANAFTVTGGPLNTAPITVTSAATGFTNNKWLGATITTNSLTGGSSPAVNVAFTTIGSAGLVFPNPVNGYNAPILPDSLGRIDSTRSICQPDPLTGTLAGVGVYSNNAIGPYASFASSLTPLLSTTIYYSVITYNDHVVIGLGTTAAVKQFYFGGMTSMVPTPATNDPLCVGSCAWLSGSNSQGWGLYGFTRMPVALIASASTIPASQYYSSCGAYASFTQNFPIYDNGIAMAAAANMTNPVADSITNTYLTSRIFLPQMANVITGTNNSAAGYRAVLNNYIVTGALPPGMVIGDTIGINGTYWMYLGLISTGVNAYADTGVSFP
jgi:hypothetical protein